MLDGGAEWTADLSTQLLPLDLYSRMYETRSGTGTPNSRGILGRGSKEQAYCRSHKAGGRQLFSSSQANVAELDVWQHKTANCISGQCGSYQAGGAAMGGQPLCSQGEILDMRHWFQSGF